MHKFVKIITIALAAAMMMSLAACSGTAESSTEATSASVESSSSSEDNGGGGGPVNPWSDAKSLEEAAQGAGLGIFEIDESVLISGEKLQLVGYSYMPGMAQAEYELGAAEIKIRKGLDVIPSDGFDISGDYNSYANDWTINLNGIEISCSGSNDGDSMRTLWKVDDKCYSIVTKGSGGESYGLSEDDLRSIVAGIK